MTSKNLIRDRRVELDLTMKELADLVGVSEGTVSRWESGDIANMKRDRIYKLSKALQISPLSLLGWNDEEGPVFPSNIIPMPEMRQIPLIGTIACGAPITAEQNVEDLVDIPKHIHADFALRCKGDSMINARIFDGDIVYIRQQPTVENGEIAAVLIEDEATLKRFRRLENQIVLEPANPLFDSLVYRGSEMEQVHILGKAVAFTSNVR